MPMSDYPTINTDMDAQSSQCKALNVPVPLSAKINLEQAPTSPNPSPYRMYL
jgi:hypothetical protein